MNNASQSTGAEEWYVTGFAREPISVPGAGDGPLCVSVSMQGGRGDMRLDPEPFWTAMLRFDRNGDGRIGRDEINEHLTLPFRPELLPEHSGFGLPLPSDPVKRKQSQLKIEIIHQADFKGPIHATPFLAGKSLYVRTGKALLASLGKEPLSPKPGARKARPEVADILRGKAGK